MYAEAAGKPLITFFFEKWRLTIFLFQFVCRFDFYDFMFSFPVFIIETHKPTAYQAREEELKVAR